MLKALAKNPANQRALLQGAGIAGDPHYVPWLIKQMDDLKLTRLAGESFSMITGLDLAYLDLDRKPPENFEAGPNDDPADPDVAMDPDDGLPWPDPERVQRWWSANQARFVAGTRYFMGEPVSRELCVRVLKEGFQRQRIAAAEYLCLLQPGTPLFQHGCTGMAAAAMAVQNDMKQIGDQMLNESSISNPLQRMEIRFDGIQKVGGLRTVNGARFGMTRDGGTRPHPGVDLYAPPGTPVFAIADGVIDRVRL